MAAPPDAQESLVAAEPKHFFRPPYVGPKGWIGINLDTGLEWGAVAALIGEGHAFIAAKRKSRGQRTRMSR